ncbi:MAG: cytochrome b [Afipia sp.]|nr:cytochrome b [Afipia sp.]
MQDDADNRYGLIAQSLHWLTVPLLAVAWALGTFDEVLPKGAARATGLSIHIAVGLAILAMLIVRLPWRLVSAPAPEPTEFGRWMTVWTDPVARITHYLLYAMLAAVPLSGIALQFAHGAGLPLFGIAEIPSPWVYDRAFAHTVKEIHEAIANALVIVACFHAAAALIHHFVFRDSTLARMLPRRKAS